MLRHYLGALLVCLAASTAVLGQVTERVSVDSTADQAGDDSSGPSVSVGGRFVAFRSAATNLVPNDTNGVFDAFVRDRDTGTTVRVSVALGGSEVAGATLGADISDTGRYVALDTFGVMVPGDTIGSRDIYVRDRDLDGDGIFDETGAGESTTVLISKSSAGVQGNGDSSKPAISGSGRFVAFQSMAMNLVPGDGNGVSDVFVHDRDTDGNGIFDEPGGFSTIRVSISSTSVEANAPSSDAAVSDDGRYVAFATDTTSFGFTDSNGLEDVYRRDLQTGTTALVSAATPASTGNSSSRTPSISSDGRFVVFASEANDLLGAGGDTNGFIDVFRRDMATGVTTLVSLSSAGIQGISSSGIYRPHVSADGRFVAFDSLSLNLLGPMGDTNGVRDVFLRDTFLGVTTRASVDSLGMEANSGCTLPAMSSDARAIAFVSASTTLVQTDTNLHADVFLRDMLCPGLVRQYGVSCPGTGGLAPLLTAGGCPTATGSLWISLSGGLGGAMAFLFFGSSQASILLPGGCLLQISPIFASPVFALPLDGVGPGEGGATVFAVPLGLSPGVLTTQGLVLDAGAPAGYSVTNGVELTIM